MKNILLLIFISLSSLIAKEGVYYYESGKQIYLHPLKNSFRTTKQTDYYENEKGIVVGVTDKLLVKMVNTTKLDMLIQEFHLKIVKKISNDLFLLQTSNKKETLRIANQLYQRKDVLFAHPDFIKKHFKR